MANDAFGSEMTLPLRTSDLQDFASQTLRLKDVSSADSLLKLSISDHARNEGRLEMPPCEQKWL